MSEKYMVETLRRCRACDWREFDVGDHYEDIVHCTNCGLLYLVDPEEVWNPVATVTPTDS
jgi:hypothetical protein